MIATRTRARATLIVSSLLLALTWSACSLFGGKQITGTGPAISDNRLLGDFTEVSNESSLNVNITRGAQSSVTVNAQREVQPAITTVNKGGKLTIDIEGNVSMQEGSVDIVVAELESFSSDGSGNTLIEGFTDGNLSLRHDGSGNLTVRDVNVERVTLKTDGSGNISLSGSADRLSIEHDGSGNVDADDFTCKDVRVKTDGSGDVSVNATNGLDVDMQGSGNVSYKGEPELKLKDEGSGELRKG